MRYIGGVKELYETQTPLSESSSSSKKLSKSSLSILESAGVGPATATAISTNRANKMKNFILIYGSITLNHWIQLALKLIDQIDAAFILCSMPFKLTA